MRIVHVTDSFLPRMGGIERQVDSLSRRQALRGDDVTVACTVASPEADPTDDARYIRRPAGWSGTQIAYHRVRRTLNDVDLRDADLVHAHLSIVSPLAALALRRAARQGVPAVATVHSLWTPTEGAAMRFVRDAGMLGDDTTTWSAVSTTAADIVARRLGTNVEVLPNGVDSAFWAGASKTPTPPRVFRIATVMRLVGRKRPLPFIAMINALRRQLPPDHDLRVRVIGDGPQRPALESAVRRAGLQSSVSLEGRLSSSGIRAVFADSDVYVAPALNESFGIAALEAHCAGLPVVAFASSGVGDIVTNARVGRLVDDDAGLVAALAQLAGARAPALATEFDACPFDWPAVLARTDEVYEQAVMRGRRGRRPSEPVRT
jgi:glycosyltransferase involved in cell wall biosynthesis